MLYYDKMNTTKFGPIAWSIAHTIPLLVQPRDDRNEAWPESTIEQFVLFMSSKAMLLPCIYCRESYRIFIRFLDLRKWFQGPLRLQPVSTAVASHYVFMLHNIVNQKLDKPWQFDEPTAVASQILTDERAFMTNLFEWLYILFGNYPQQIGPNFDIDEVGECCNEACRRANQTLHSRDELNAPYPQCQRKYPPRCISKQLRGALEHVKRQVATISYMVGANKQGVTIGSYINKQLIQPVYENMLSGDIQDAIDFYTFSKICWYVIMLRNLLQMLLLLGATDTTVAEETNTFKRRSPEAVRALQQLHQSFIEPSREHKHDNADEKPCDCAHGDSVQRQSCLKAHLFAWSSSAEAVKQLHFARQLWDVKTEPLGETLQRIEKYRAKSHK